MSDDFSQAPPSLAERRAARDDDCTLWTPRDLLLHFLRLIDNGELAPDAMIVCYSIKTRGYTRTGLRRAKCGVTEAVGILELTKADLIAATEVEPP